MIKGIVLNTDKKPVPFASVYYSGNKGVAANDKGAFSIQVEKKDVKNLRISSVGYNEMTFPLNSFGLYVLRSNSKQLDPVIIKAKRKNTNDTTPPLPPVKVDEKGGNWLWIIIAVVVIVGMIYLMKQNKAK